MLPIIYFGNTDVKLAGGPHTLFAKALLPLRADLW